MRMLVLVVSDDTILEFFILLGIMSLTNLVQRMCEVIEEHEIYLKELK